MITRIQTECYKFDAIGDVQGCYDQLIELVGSLGYRCHNGLYSHSAGRQLVFVGDIIDRGPRSDKTLQFVYEHCKAGLAYCVMGNHDIRLQKYINGNKHGQPAGFALAIKQIEKSFSYSKMRDIGMWLDEMPYCLIINDKLLVTHAGLASKDWLDAKPNDLKQVCVFGEKNGKLDKWGYKELKVAADFWDGNILQVHGHFKQGPYPIYRNNTVNVDTAPDFGGRMSAARIDFDKDGNHTINFAWTKPNTWNWDVLKEGIITTLQACEG